MADLTPYVPRLLLQWEERYGQAKHQSIDGTLVFADVSGFTKLSEALARKSGKAGAEEMADVINYLFGELLMLAAVRGGEMLKYGGDAMLLFFTGEHHAPRAAAACADMQRRLREIGRIDTGGAGIVRLRMSVGAHSGSFDFFVGGRRHRELLVAGPDTTVTVEMESAAEATEVLVSPALAALLPARNVGQGKHGGFLLRGNPRADVVDTTPLSTEVDASRFLSGAVASHVAAEAAQPEHRLATVCFLQFLELDRLLGDANRADEAAERVDDVLTLVEEVMAEHKVSFLATDLAADGGKVMAASGAPISHGQDEERMLLACRRILDDGPALPVRIGLQRGHVFAGDVGPAFRRTYTTLGDVTNTAARVMGKAGPGQLFALRPVLDRSAQRFEMVEQPSFMAKGKSEPLVPFAVGDPTKQRVDVSGEVPMIGRDELIGDLAADLATLLESGGAVEVVAEDGMGKTRVANAAIEKVAPAHVRTTTAQDHLGGRPYAVLGGLVPDEAWCEEHVPALAPWLPLLAIVHGRERPPTPEVEALDATAIVPRLTAAVADALVAAMPGGGVLVVDDAHEADRASLDVLARLAGDERRPGIALVVTRAPEGPELPSATVIEVPPLDDASARRLVRTVAGVPLLPQHLATIVERGDGNPLFLAELARSYATDPEELPESIEATIAARIDGLPTSARLTLRTAAVVGDRFDLGLVETLLAGAADWADLGDLVVADEQTGRFRHRSARAAAYEGLPFRRRRELHATVATSLEESGAPPAELSHHFLAAGEHRKAWSYGLAAGRSAVAAYAHADAAKLFAQALSVERNVDADATERTAAWRDLGLSRLYSGEVEEARRAYAQARRRAADPATLGNLFVCEVDALLRIGDPRRAEQWCRRGLKALRSAGDDPDLLAQRARLEVGLAGCRRQRGDLAGARRWCAAAVENAIAAGDRRVELHARSLDHLAAVGLGAEDREVCGASARALAEDVGTGVELGTVLNNIALDLQMHGRFSEAAPVFEEAFRSFDAAGSPVEAGVAANNLAEILIELNQFDDAETKLAEALDIFEAAKIWYAIIALANLGTLETRRGRYELAQGYLDRAAQQAAAVTVADMRSDIDQRQAELAARRGNSEGEDEGVVPDRPHHGASAV